MWRCRNGWRPYTPRGRGASCEGASHSEAPNCCVGLLFQLRAAHVYPFQASGAPYSHFSQPACLYECDYFLLEVSGGGGSGALVGLKRGRVPESYGARGIWDGILRTTSTCWLGLSPRQPAEYPEGPMSLLWAFERSKHTVRARDWSAAAVQSPRHSQPEVVTLEPFELHEGKIIKQVWRRSNKTTLPLATRAQASPDSGSLPYNSKPQCPRPLCGSRCRACKDAWGLGLRVSGCRFFGVLRKLSILT